MTVQEEIAQIIYQHELQMKSENFADGIDTAEKIVDLLKSKGYVCEMCAKRLS